MIKLLDSFSALVLAIILIGLTNGQLNQTCIHTNLVTPCHFFKTDEALGKWYVQEIYTGLKEDATPTSFKCLEIKYYRNSTINPKILAVEEKYINILSGNTKTDLGNIEINDDNVIEAIWTLSSDAAVGPIQITDTVWFHTDYKSWGIKYNCKVINNYRFETFIVYSRDRLIDSKTLTILRQLAIGYGFLNENIRVIDQSSCPS